ncbi:unnamed protein product [Meganyctiphanes norvegica]|uniref:Uncharacterized protein n=1 Tax=Meganyctiphanes norvegica TaxID=48144 RepID=A0AAV2S9Y3_MEGNR
MGSLEWYGTDPAKKPERFNGLDTKVVTIIKAILNKDGHAIRGSVRALVKHIKSSVVDNIWITLQTALVQQIPESSEEKPLTFSRFDSNSEYGLDFWPNSDTTCLDDFHFISVLGQGSFGKVVLSQLKDTGEYFAIKALKKRDIIDRKEIESVFTEKQILEVTSSVQHPFLINSYSSFQTKDHVCFVLEYAPGGDLMTHILEGAFDEHQAVFYAACVLLGLQYLHDNGIIYRDIKLENIMLDAHGYAKIADFGLSKENIRYDDFTDTFCGTSEFMAPEVLNEDSYTQAVDWWGFGVLIFQMLVGDSPFSGNNDDEIFTSIINDEVCYPRFLSLEAISIIRKLLQKNPDKRLGSSKRGAEDIKIQNFFRDMRWDELLQKKIKPPFRPNLISHRDVRNFDTEFTYQNPNINLIKYRCTITPKEQSLFKDFSYMADWC